MGNILFLDTETASFGPQRTGDRFGPMCQIAAILRAPNGSELTWLCTLIQPDGWEIKDDAAAVHHISQADCMDRGRPISEVLLDVRDMARSAHSVVAHNAVFDLGILAREAEHAGLEWPRIPHMFCTMRASTDICRIPSKTRGYKYPKLQEAHRMLLGHEFEGAHDALQDVRACIRLYDHLTKDQPVAQETPETRFINAGHNWQDDLLDSLPSDRHRTMLRRLLNEPQGPVDISFAYRGAGVDLALKVWEIEQDLVRMGLVWWPPYDLDVPRPSLTVDRCACQARGLQIGAAMRLAKQPKE